MVTKEQQQIIFEALLDADFSTRYWSRMGRRYQQRDRWINILLAVVSSGTVASWALWQKYPIAWQTLSVVTAGIATAQPFFNLTGTMEQIFNAQAKWVEFEFSYQQLWNNLANMDTDSAMKTFHELQHKQVNLAAECARLPSDDENLQRECYEAVRIARNLQNR